MNHWTQSAKEVLESYLARVHPSLGASGADADEVAADLQRHVNEELAGAKLSSVTADDVRRVLARLGEPEILEHASTSVPSRLDTETAAGAPEDAPGPRRKRYPLCLFLGFFLPVITLVFEFTTGWCGEIFFDPLPTGWHVLLVAAVPLANAMLWWRVALGRQDYDALAWVAGGYVLAVGLLYTVLYLPLTVPAILGIIFFGFGLLPLAPLLSLVASVRLLAGAVDCPAGTAARNRRLAMASGAGTGLILMLLASAPDWMTHHWARQVAEAPSSEEARGPLRWLRRLGKEETLLRACYVTNVRGLGGIAGWDRALTGRPPKSELAQRIYFQMTGRAFNEVQPPQARYSSARWAYLDDFTWDEGHGGQAVAGKVKGLSLEQSRLDGLVDAEAGWSYVEWVMEFRNVGLLDREARAQIALPPGGVVSRLTLWVHGEEREAAFAGTAQTRSAYNEVAIRQRRDPVLVTSAGSDRILMQCFPVPRDGGTIKIRLGITAPWILESQSQAALKLPCFLERNFRVPEGGRHSVWIESSHPLEAAATGLAQDHSQQGKVAWRGEIVDSDLSGVQSVFRARRTSGSNAAWVKDGQSKEESYVLQSASLSPASAVSRLVFVLDGAVGMNGSYEAMAEALDRVNAGTEVAVLLAQDGVTELWPPRVWAKADEAALGEIIRRCQGEGGQDNLEALLRAWDLAAMVSDGVVVWIHGPQPVSLDQIEWLKQRMLWRPKHSTRIFSLQTHAGPNRVAEVPETSLILKPEPRLGPLTQDLRRLLSRLGKDGQSWEFVRSKSKTRPASSAMNESSRHLARLWARDEVARLMASKQTGEAVRTAAQHQLVTPVSGAVVLETQAQFARAGLEPVAAETVPTVPEPGTWALVLLGTFGGFVMWRLRRRRGPRGTPERAQD